VAGWDTWGIDRDRLPSPRSTRKAVYPVSPRPEKRRSAGARERSRSSHSFEVVDEEGPWQFRGPDPSEVLSPYTSQRLREALEQDAPIALEDGIRVECVDVEAETFDVIGTDGASFTTRNQPVLATGFESGLGLVDECFDFENGHPKLTERDESTTTSGLFLAGPQVAHNGQQFCFIYKFRQRFAVVADEIATRLDVDRTPLDEYREKGMFLEDLPCCEPDMCDC